MSKNLVEFIDEFRDAVLDAMDEVSNDFNLPLVEDADLPSLFETLDDLAEKVWNRKVFTGSSEVD